MSRLDASLALKPLGEGVFAASADPAYEANSGMFGGWTAALIVNAALSDSRASGSCSSLSMHFLKMIPPGSDRTKPSRQPRPPLESRGRIAGDERTTLLVPVSRNE